MLVKLSDVYLIGTYPLYCDGCRTILNQISNDLQFHTISECPEPWIKQFRNHKARLVIFDLMSFGYHGLDILISLRLNQSKLPVIVFSDLTKEQEKLCFQLGVKKILSKQLPISELKQSLNDFIYPAGYEFTSRKALIENNKPAFAKLVLNKRILTIKEIATARCLLDGMNNRDIAKYRGVCESTTKRHISSLLNKLHVINRTEIVAQLEKLRKIPPKINQSAQRP